MKLKLLLAGLMLRAYAFAQTGPNVVLSVANDAAVPSSCTNSNVIYYVQADSPPAVFGCNGTNFVKINGTGGGSTYTLPIAQPSTLGGIKPDNVTITVDPVTGIATAVFTPGLSDPGSNGVVVRTALNTTASVAAPAGTIVGTSDTQTLTNKSLSASEITSGTLAAALMPALSGDISTSAGTIVTALQNVSTTFGVCGDATHVCQITSDAKGRVTAQSAVAVSGGGGGGGSFPASSLGGSGMLQITSLALDGNPAVLPALEAANEWGAVNAFDAGIAAGSTGQFSVNSTGDVTLHNLTCTGTGCGSGGGGLPDPGSNGLVVRTALNTTSAVAAPSGTIVGTSDTQTLTNKSIDGSEINSGTIPAAQLPLATTSAFGGVKCDGVTTSCTSGVIAAIGTIATNVVANSGNLIGSGTTPTVIVTGSGCALGAVAGTNLSGTIPVTGTGSACVVQIVASTAVPAHYLCPELQDRNSHVTAVQTADSTITATFASMTITSGDILQYGTCSGN